MTILVDPPAPDDQWAIVKRYPVGIWSLRSPNWDGAVGAAVAGDQIQLTDQPAEHRGVELLEALLVPQRAPSRRGGRHDATSTLDKPRRFPWLVI
jgi:hypothetical protein